MTDLDQIAEQTAAFVTETLLADGWEHDSIRALIAQYDDGDGWLLGHIDRALDHRGVMIPTEVRSDYA